MTFRRCHGDADDDGGGAIVLRLEYHDSSQRRGQDVTQCRHLPT